MTTGPPFAPVGSEGLTPFGAETEERLLTAFRRAAAEVPAYRTVLREKGVRVSEVTDLKSFSQLCPLLSKADTFDRFPIDQLGPSACPSDLADVLTSSGRGGRFSFGLSTRAQAAATVTFLDEAFDQAFEVKSRTTLAINCLPMGVGFSSHLMTIATTSVREDMAVALVQSFGPAYDQIVLVGDPLFLKRLTDYAAAAGVDWGRYRVNVILGEEIFGENYRTYLSGCLGADVRRADRGYIMSSFGVGELGLHLGYETRATIGLRRAAHANASFARELFAADIDAGAPLPTLLAFNPLRTFLEIVDADVSGYGQLTTSMLDSDRRVPLLRYQTGDVATLIDPDRVIDLTARHGVEVLGPIPRALFALRGRQTQVLPNGWHVGLYKDALYADHSVAAASTGAVRLTVTGRQCTMHVQLVPTATPSTFLEQRILSSVPRNAQPSRVVLWPYAQFPFGMTLDYERKFPYYLSGEPEPASEPILACAATPVA